MSGCSIRLATLADGPRCNDFHNAYYGNARTLDQWMWTFARMPAEDGTLAFAIAERGGEVVGTQALIPIELIGRGGIVASAKSEETLVAESARGQGLFARLYEPLLDRARKSGIAAIWGFTPAASAFRKAGFDVPARTAQIFRPLGAGAAAALRDRENESALEAFASRALCAYGSVRAALGAQSNALTFQTLEKAPAWADSFSRKFAEMWGGCTIHRSTDYLSWRLFGNPYTRPVMIAAFAAGDPVGWVCISTSSRAAAIVDIVAVNAPGIPADEVTQSMLRQAADHARATGAGAIRCWSVTDHPYDLVLRRAARKLGWLRIRRGHDVVLMPLDASRMTPFAEWYVSRIFTEGRLG